MTDTAVAVLPKNFDSLNYSQQKKVISTELLEMNMQLANIDQEEEELKERARALKVVIEGSKEFKALVKIRKQVKSGKDEKQLILSERNGVLKISKRFGIDMTAEVKNMKQLSSNN